MKTFKTIAKENEKVIRQMYESFQKGNLPGILQFLAPDCILTVPGSGLNSGEYWGHAGFEKFFGNIMNYFGGKFSEELTAFAASDKHVFVREFNILNRKEDPQEDWQLPMVMMYTLRNGMISEMRVVPEYMDVYNAYWTPGAPNPRKSDDLFANGKHKLGDAVSILKYDFMLNKYFAFWNGNYDAFKESMSDDTIFFLPGKSFLAGSYKGFAGYMEFREKLAKFGGDKYQLMVEGFAASETDIFVLEHIRMNSANQKEVADIYVIMQFVLEDNTIIRANDFPLDTVAYENFFRM